MGFHWISCQLRWTIWIRRGGWIPISASRFRSSHLPGVRYAVVAGSRSALTGSTICSFPVATQLGLSLRQLERKFVSATGVPPEIFISGRAAGEGARSPRIHQFANCGDSPCLRLQFVYSLIKGVQAVIWPISLTRAEGVAWVMDLIGDQHGPCTRTLWAGRLHELVRSIIFEYLRLIMQHIFRSSRTAPIPELRLSICPQHVGYLRTIVVCST